MMVDSSANGYFIRLSEISKTSLSDSSSDSEDDDDDESDDEDDDDAEAEDALLLFFFGVFSGVNFFAFSFGDFSLLDPRHLGEVVVSNFGSGFTSFDAGRVICVCSG